MTVELAFFPRKISLFNFHSFPGDCFQDMHSSCCWQIAITEVNMNKIPFYDERKEVGKKKRKKKDS